MEKPLSKLGIILGMIAIAVIVMFGLVLTSMAIKGKYVIRIEVDDNFVKAMNETSNNRYNPFDDFPRAYSTSDKLFLGNGETKACYRLNEDYGAIKKGDYLCPI